MLNTRAGDFFNANDVINSNDLRKRIINVDSAFRSNIEEPSTNFTYKLEHSFKNIIRLRVASVEIPNMFYTFTKNNNSFIVKAYDITSIVRTVTITIPEGNYAATEIIETIQELLNTELRDKYGIYISISLNSNNTKVTFRHDGVSNYPVIGPNPAPSQSAQPFLLDFITTSPLNKRKQHFGLGFNLGFRLKTYKVTNATEVAPMYNIYTITSEGCLDVVGKTYMFLCVNDYYSVEQKTDETYFECLAKIIVREDKFTVIYDDGSSLLSNDIIFPSPVDLKYLKVKLVDPYGEVIDLCGLNFSFSLEITEVLNTKLYDFYRNYIWLGTVPSVNYKKVQGSAQPLLKGVGPPW